jgi:hypothetical protein
MGADGELLVGTAPPRRVSRAARAPDPGGWDLVVRRPNLLMLPSKPRNEAVTTIFGQSICRALISSVNS